MACVAFTRAIGPVILDVVVSEKHTSEMEVAEHPVERGAKVSDHAWRKAIEVEMEIAVGDGAIGAYEGLLALQKMAEPFTLVTGLKVYQDMIVTSIEATRDKEHSQILFGTAKLKEIILTSTQAGGSTGDTSDTRAQGQTNRGQVQAREVGAGDAGFDRIISGLGAAG